MTTHSQRALILYRRRRFINHLLTYLLIYLLKSLVHRQRAAINAQHKSIPVIIVEEANRRVIVLLTADVWASTMVELR